MLLEFSVANFRSIYEKKTFTLEACSRISENPGNIVKHGSYNILRSAAIYGANSSGKTNLIKALSGMRKLIIDSVKLNDQEELMFDPFLLRESSVGEPTFFELIFLKGTTRYRYGFEYNSDTIISEWLFRKKTRKKKRFFLYVTKRV